MIIFFVELSKKEDSMWIMYNHMYYETHTCIHMSVYTYVSLSV